MARTIAELTPGDLRELIADVVEQKLLDLLGDPDEGLALRPELRDRLLRQQERVRGGDRGTPLDEVLTVRR
ncbi:MAG TPA: hypothetical protein VNJ70_15980 [Thermoanaerobaculia bacterium]|nr:hypothetical protein [Thermoanaerobaculia bacterium]